MVGRTRRCSISSPLSRASLHKAVAITGQRGTDKEVVARALHSLSSNRGDPFVASNCASSVETLIEPGLLGHLKGSFAGAISGQIMNRTMQSLMEGK
ncbi:MAG: sigma 54-interacting transcriptional regulator [Syntrophorhabdales bacterium]